MQQRVGRLAGQILAELLRRDDAQLGDARLHLTQHHIHHPGVARGVFGQHPRELNQNMALVVDRGPVLRADVQARTADRDNDQSGGDGPQLADGARWPRTRRP
jgi:hypothetical protein